MRMPDSKTAETLTRIEWLLDQYIRAVETGEIDAELGIPDRDVVEARDATRDLLVRLTGRKLVREAGDGGR